MALWKRIRSQLSGNQPKRLSLILFAQISERLTPWYCDLINQHILW
jgi:hypothetical protein